MPNSTPIDPDTLAAARLCVRAWSGEREDGYLIEGPGWDVEQIVSVLGEVIATLDVASTRRVIKRDTPNAAAREVVEDRGETLVLRFGPNGCGRQVTRSIDYITDTT